MLAMMNSSNMIPEMSNDNASSDEYEDSEEIKASNIPSSNISSKAPDASQFKTYMAPLIEQEKFWTHAPETGLNQNIPKSKENPIHIVKEAIPKSEPKMNHVPEINNLAPNIDIPKTQSIKIISPENVKNSQSSNTLPIHCAFDYSPNIKQDLVSNVENKSAAKSKESAKETLVIKKSDVIPSTPVKPEIVKVAEVPKEVYADIAKINNTLLQINEELKANKSEIKKQKELIEDMQIMLDSKTQVFEKSEEANRDLAKRIQHIEDEHKALTKTDKLLKDSISNYEVQQNKYIADIQSQHKIINELKENVKANTINKSDVEKLKKEIADLKLTLHKPMAYEVKKVEENITSPSNSKESSSAINGNAVNSPQITFSPISKDILNSENKNPSNITQQPNENIQAPAIKPKLIQRVVDQQLLDSKFRECIFANKGVIYEDGILQIGIIKSQAEDVIAIEVFFGNIQNDININLLAFKSIYFDANSIALQVGELPTIIEKRKQSKVTIQVKVKAPFLNYIRFLLEYQYSDSNQLDDILTQKCQLNLPVNFLHLCHGIATDIDVNPIIENPDNHKSDGVFALDSVKISSMKILKSVLSMNNRISLFPTIEKMTGRLVCGTEYNGVQAYAVLQIGKNPSESSITAYSKDKVLCDVFATNILHAIAFVKSI